MSERSRTWSHSQIRLNANTLIAIVEMPGIFLVQNICMYSEVSRIESIGFLGIAGIRSMFLRRTIFPGDFMYELIKFYSTFGNVGNLICLGEHIILKQDL